MSKVRTPTIPTAGIQDPAVRQAIEAIAERLEVGDGQRPNANKLDRFIRLRDLVDTGIASVAKQISDAGPGFEYSNPGLITFTRPPAPTNLTASGAMASVFLSWDQAPFRNYSYTEIWRAGVDDIGQATLVGTAIAPVYADYVGSNQTAYYWVRFVSTAAIKGPFNATAGTLGQTSQDPAYMLEVLSGEIQESELHATLNDRIDLVDGPDTLAGSVNARVKTVQTQVDDLELQYTVKLDNNGFMSGFGIASTSSGASAFSEFYALTDRFAIINPAVSPLTVSEITRSLSTATATTSTGHGLAVGDYTVLTGAEQSEYNGTKKVTAIVSATQFEFAVSGTPATPATVAAGFAAIKAAKSKVPFIVQGGEVYMDAALIKDASILKAKIGSVAAEAIDAGIVNVAIELTAASITGGNMNINNRFFVDSNGNLNINNKFLVDSLGNMTASDAYLDNAYVRGDVEADSLKANAAAIVETLHLRGQAVTIPVSAYTAGITTISDDAWTTVQSVTINSTGAPIFVLGHFVTEYVSYADNRGWGYRILRGGTAIVESLKLHQDGMEYANVPISDTPGAGIVTYSLQAWSSNSIGKNIRERFLSLIETKR